MTDRSQTPAEDSTHAEAWTLDPRIAMLNHGSFWACPRVVLERQQQLRAEMEREPVGFFFRRMQPLLDESRRVLAGLISADPADLVFVRNATTAINSVLGSLHFQPGNQLLVTDHDYNACRNAVRFTAEQAGAEVVVASVPLPVESPGQVVDAVLSRVTERTRLAVIDHVTSPTAIVFPIEEIVRRLKQRNVDTLVDGAHAPGMVRLDLGRIGAAYYTGNCHKWLCAPKGAAFLHVQPEKQQEIQPAVISHGFNTPRPGYTPFQDAFDWVGTDDLTPWLCVGEAIRFLDGLSGGGIEELMGQNRRLVLEGRRTLCDALDVSPTCPEEMTGSMSALRLPDDADRAAALDTSTAITPIHRLQSELLERFDIQVPVYHWPAAPRKLLAFPRGGYHFRAL
ncbi:MAG: aminotransferase class V-fold PLP-dependent enzyme [Planctomycetota bacterium]|jgi:isopenicillin-N epimerase